MRRNFLIKIKPFLAAIAIVATLAPSIVVPQKAAAFPGDAVFVIGGHLDLVKFIPQLSITNANTGGQLHQTFFEWAQTFVLETVKKRLLDTIVDQIISWIQGGDTPQFITNWGQFLEDAGNVAAGDFAKGIGAAALCSPFSAQIKLAFGPPSGNNFRSPITCTLDQIVSNIDDFYKNFSNGGWLAYETSLQPNNTAIGAYLIAFERQTSLVTVAQRAAEAEGIANGGYLSTKECLEPFQASPNPALGPDLDHDGKYGDYDCRITTPGSTIGNLLNQATWVGTGIPGILSAKQLNEYLAAIGDSLLSRLIQEGIGGLRNLTTAHASNGSGGGTNRCSAYSGNQYSACSTTCKDVSGDLLASCVGYAETAQNNLTFAVSDLVDKINLSLVPRQDAQAKLQSALTITQGLITYLNSKKTNSAMCAFIVQPDIDTASSTIATLTSEINANQTVIDPLVSAINSLSSLSINDWASYTTLANQIPSSLDSESAQTLLATADIQLNGTGSPFCQNAVLTCQGVTQFNTDARSRASTCN